MVRQLCPAPACPPFLNYCCQGLVCLALTTQQTLTGRPCRHTVSFTINDPIPAGISAFWLRCAEEKQARGPEVAAAQPARARAGGRAHAEGGGRRGGQSHPLACQGGQHRALGRPSHPWVSASHACYRLCRCCQALEAHPSALSHEPSRVCKNTEILEDLHVAG